jgi:hypothetical protein
VFFSNDQDNSESSFSAKSETTDKMSEWWFWNNQKEERHFFEDVNSMY